MKARTIASLWLMMAVMAAAQTTPPSQKVAPATTPSAPAASAAAPTSAKPKQAAPAAKKAAPVTAQKAPVAKPKVAKKAPAAPKAKPAAVAAAKPAAPRPPQQPSKRDPFVSPVREASAAGGPTCVTGKRCLAIDSIVLRGIVKSQFGMIAVVEGGARKVSYFLRENDPVFNGYVAKITMDSIIFRENVLDRMGKQSTRDVEKKVSAPVV